jgi:hypothetical protein
MGGPAPKTARQITRSRGPDLGSKEQEAAMVPIPMIPIARSGVFDRGGSEAA